VHRNETNLGSAGAFSQGIAIACNNGADFILLLDDDNLPRDGAIRGLINTYASLSKDVSRDKLVVTAYRECLHSKFRIPLSPIFMAGHDFLNFNLFNAFQRHLKLIKHEEKITSGPEYSMLGRGGAYSGMLFSKALVQNIGLPNADYVLYHDDIDFVIRILNAGGVVWLDIDSIIDDIVTNYSVSVFKIPVLGFVLSESDSKIYYIMRNRAYIDKYVEKRRSLFYNINKMCLILLASFCCIILFKVKRLITIHEACFHAWKGQLGLNPRYPI
jgi:hypothetical protein